MRVLIAAILIALVGALLVPQFREVLLDIWARFQAGGNLSAVIVVLVVIFVLGVILMSSDRA